MHLTDVKLVGIDRTVFAGDDVLELGSTPRVLYGQDVLADDAPRIAHADVCPGTHQVTVLQTRDLFLACQPYKVDRHLYPKAFGDG